MISLRKTENCHHRRGGPAGLSAAITAQSLGAKVTLIVQDKLLGGQLINRPICFLAPKSSMRPTRGIDIAKLLEAQCQSLENISILFGGDRCWLL